MISRKETGLSKSRNLAIREAKGDICIFSDDDCVYKNGFEKVVEDAYKKYKDIDIICFFMNSENKHRKIKKIRTSRVGRIKAMKIVSFEITFRREILKDIIFDEDFGAGARYDHGEETIFLYDCIKRGLKVKFVNKEIGRVIQKDSSWFKGYDRKFFEDQGAIFYKLSKGFYRGLILQFAIRKHVLYKENMKLNDAIRYMQKGAKEYIHNK